VALVTISSFVESRRFPAQLVYRFVASAFVKCSLNSSLAEQINIIVS